jgi:hypothetical protein
MTGTQVVVVIAAGLLVIGLAGLAIMDALTHRGEDDDPTWKDDYTGWGG